MHTAADAYPNVSAPPSAATRVSDRWLMGLLVTLVAISAHPWTTVRRVPVEVLDVTHFSGAGTARWPAAADALFVVSNGTVRNQVAAACARLGVRWYGPTFDS